MRHVSTKSLQTLTINDHGRPRVIKLMIFLSEGGKEGVAEKLQIDMKLSGGELTGLTVCLS